VDILGELASAAEPAGAGGARPEPPRE
jgi:hypothetical protein